MSERAPNRVVAGFSSLEGGMDSGRAPHLIQPNQYANGFNMTARGGHPCSRPGLKKVPLTFLKTIELPDHTIQVLPDPVTQAFFESEGRWQHAGHYQPDFGNSSLIAVIGGRFFQLNVGGNNTVQEITIPGDPNSSVKDQGWSLQAEMFWLYNDGESRRFVFDGSKAWREGPAGTVMAYSKNRIWYSLPSGFAFRAGDVCRGDTGTPAYQNRDSILRETENIHLNEGGDFSVPGNSGGIRAMRPVAILDKSLGQGPLQVLTTNMIFSVDAPADRDLWKDVTYPIQTESLIGSGGQSQLATVSVNGDIFFRAKDGIRSLVLARRQFNSWSNVPQSSEMNRYLRRDSRSLLRFSSAVEFDNRLLHTFSPSYSDRGVWHRGLVVLDFDLLSSLRNQTDPAYDGIWTGLRILQVVKGQFGDQERCFMFVLNADDKIELWEQSIDDHFDNGTKRIVWGFESGRYGFTSGLTQMKRLDGGHFFLDSIEGRVDFEIRYRPDSYPFWIFWLAGQKCASKNDCSVDEGGCLTLEQFQQGYEAKIGLTEPSDVCNPYAKRMYRDLFQCQVRFQFTGYGQITEAVLYATDQVMPPFGECQLTEAICEPITGCGISPYDYSAE